MVFIRLMIKAVIDSYSFIQQISIPYFMYHTLLRNMLNTIMYLIHLSVIFHTLDPLCEE